MKEKAQQKKRIGVSTIAHLIPHTYRRARRESSERDVIFFPRGKVNIVERMTNGNYRVPVRDR